MPKHINTFPEVRAGIHAQHAKQIRIHAVRSALHVGTPDIMLQRNNLHGVIRVVLIPFLQRVVYVSAPDETDVERYLYPFLYV